MFFQNLIIFIFTVQTINISIANALTVYKNGNTIVDGDLNGGKGIYATNTLTTYGSLVAAPT